MLTCTSSTGTSVGSCSVDPSDRSTRCLLPIPVTRCHRSSSRLTRFLSHLATKTNGCPDGQGPKSGFSISVSTLELNAFEFPLLSSVLPVGNAVTTMTITKIISPQENNGRSVQNGHKVSSVANRANPHMDALYSARGTEPCRLSLRSNYERRAAQSKSIRYFNKITVGASV